MSRNESPTDDFRDLENAMEVWREDADRTAARLDVDALAARVVDEVVRKPRLSIAPTTARWYAAAALVLLGVGIGGTLLIRSHQPAAGADARWSLLEEELVDVIVNDTDTRYAPSLGVEGN